MTKQIGSILFIKILRYGIAGILIIAPFYAALSIWVVSGLKHSSLLKSWKEVVLLALVAIMVGFLISHREFTAQIFRQKIVWLVAVYILLIGVICSYDLIVKKISYEAVAYGALLDLRTVGMFIVAVITFAASQQSKLRNLSWRKIVLIPAALVVIFGILQITVLPKNVLNHVGYGSSTTTPYQTVDNQPSLVRIQATLKGPNPFGAYLVIVITLIASCFIISKNKLTKVAWAVFGVLALLVLYNTYSRSAELALFISITVYLALKKGQFISKHTVSLVAATSVVVAIGVFAATRHNYLAQNILFHTSNRSGSAVSSNEQRAGAMQTATKDIIHHPLGGGVGSAGPASRRNEIGPVKIAENYYLQLAQEIGIAGMVLFAAINILLGYELWKRREGETEKFLLATLVGLTVVNMFYHAWTDDTLAYLWWGLAGIALAPAILTNIHKRNNGEVKEKTT